MSRTDPLATRRAEWIAALRAGRLDEYVSLITQDAVWAPPGTSALHSRTAIRAWLEPFVAQYEYDMRIERPSVRLAGDWAVERGAFLSRLRPRAGGDWHSHRGTYVILWRRLTDGQWYIDRYLDTTELAEPSAPD